MNNLFQILLKHLFLLFLFSILFAQPEINVSPDSFYTIIYTGTSEEQIMTISNISESNSGGSNLMYEIDSIEYLSWLELSSLEGVLNPGSFDYIDLQFNAQGLNAGLYVDTLRITSNDGNNPEIEVPIALEVEGTPEINISSDTLDFDTVFVGYSSELTLNIANNGTDELILSDYIVSGSEFSIDAAPSTLQPGEFIDISITLLSQSAMDIQEILTIYSNDPDESELTILLAANAVYPPIIEIFPTSMSSSLETGQTEEQILTISNLGESNLDYSISLINDFDRWSLRNYNFYEDQNILTLEEVRNISNGMHNFTRYPKTQQIQTENTERPQGNWQLLANDPQDNNSGNYGEPGYDVENIYYELTDSSLNLKYEYYEPWENPWPATVCILHINLDNDIQTGAEVGENNGIDMIVYLFGVGFPWPPDGVYIYDDLNNNGFIQVEGLLWDQRDYNSNEFSFGFSNEYFTGLRSVHLLSSSGSPYYMSQDNVPNEGMLELFLEPIWLSVDQDSGIVFPGEANDINIIFDPLELVSGNYSAMIELENNDPSSLHIEIPVNLNVTGFPIINFPDQIDFGQIYAGYPDTLEVEISNNGTDTLFVSDFVFQDDWLSSNQTELILMPFEQSLLHLIASVDYPDTMTSSISFSTNDPMNPVIENIPVNVNTVIPPIIDVSPSEFMFIHNSSFSEEAELVITNSGGVPLTWDLEIEYPEIDHSHWVFFEKTNGSDPSYEENQDRVTYNTWLTKDFFGPIFNIVQELEADHECYFSESPIGTLWSPFPKEDSQQVHYLPFLSMTSCCPSCIVGDTVSVWLQALDVKLNVVFSSWTTGGQGGYSYYREEAPPRWLLASDMEGNIDAGESQHVNIQINSTNLSEGEYSLNLRINTNAPANDSISIPVNLVRYLSVVDNQIPDDYMLYPAYPNPFNPSTSIRFDIPKNTNEKVQLHIFDIKGRLVENLLSKRLQAGTRTMRWTPSNKSSGIYFLKMKTEDYQKTYKMILMK